MVGAVVTGIMWAGDSCNPLSIMLASWGGGGGGGGGEGRIGEGDPNFGCLDSAITAHLISQQYSCIL